MSAGVWPWKDTWILPSGCQGAGRRERVAAQGAEVHGRVFHNGVPSLAFWESEWLERGHLGMRTWHQGSRHMILIAETMTREAMWGRHT